MIFQVIYTFYLCNKKKYLFYLKIINKYNFCVIKQIKLLNKYNLIYNYILIYIFIDKNQCLSMFQINYIVHSNNLFR